MAHTTEQLIASNEILAADLERRGDTAAWIPRESAARLRELAAQDELQLSSIPPQWREWYQENVLSNTAEQSRFNQEKR